MKISHIVNAIKRRVVAYCPKKVVREPVYVPVLQSELLKGRVALITGGTSGIGFAMATAFIKSGAKVILTGRSQERVDNAVAQLGSCARGFQLDNADVGKFKNCLDMCFSKFGMPDILVNNAGRILCSTFGHTLVDDYDSIMDVNLRGAYFLSQEISNRWIASGVHGNILNVGSSSSLRPGNSPYVLSKWGMRALTIGLAKELIKHEIVVNGIAPGPTSTKLFVKDGMNGINWDRNPTGRLTTEEEIANLAVILVSDMGRMVVGDMLFASGGAGVITVDDL